MTDLCTRPHCVRPASSAGLCQRHAADAQFLQEARAEEAEAAELEARKAAQRGGRSSTRTRQAPATSTPTAPSASGAAKPTMMSVLQERRPGESDQAYEDRMLRLTSDIGVARRRADRALARDELAATIDLMLDGPPTPKAAKAFADELERVRTEMSDTVPTLDLRAEPEVTPEALADTIDRMMQPGGAPW